MSRVLKRLQTRRLGSGKGSVTRSCGFLPIPEESVVFVEEEKVSNNRQACSSVASVKVNEQKRLLVVPNESESSNFLHVESELAAPSSSEVSSRTMSYLTVPELTKLNDTTSLSRSDAATGLTTDVGCGSYWFNADLQQMAASLAHGAEELARQLWNRSWRVVPHAKLPLWLKDNDFLVANHRPPMCSYADCFKSIFRVHTETVNIWTHLLGCVIFIVTAVYYLIQPSSRMHWIDKIVYMCFFIGAILCLGFSCLFHTVFCHSQRVGQIFNKLDYCGIAFLTMGSFVPYLYYSFYCNIIPMLTYLVAILLLGSLSIVISLNDKFSTPAYRSLRAAVFMALGLSGAVPCLHFVIVEGFWLSIINGSLGWLALMALLYITGALTYATRIPERCFPGKFDIIFQSHQIFHVFVVAAAMVHFYGIAKLSHYRTTTGDCAGPIVIVEAY